MSGEARAERQPLTYRMRPGQPPDLKAYQAEDGYAALRLALKKLAPGDVTQIVKDANLRGRGGAGFPAGVKWSFVPMGPDAPAEKYVLCNADEMEPCAFMDRRRIDDQPRRLIEVMICAGYAIQAYRGYIIRRGESVLAAERMNRARAEARAAGFLGDNILGSGWSYAVF